jgi:hypothetical protein
VSYREVLGALQNKAGLSTARLERSTALMIIQSDLRAENG